MALQVVNDYNAVAYKVKDFTLRLLNKTKVAEQRGLWQLVNIGGSIALVLLFGGLVQWRRGKGG
ncbi:hypothetical protein [Foetidibacter luteolus]|uniref:hypothetical protein n=1 Tax=Foetidibacter luteolus TaxID=2608880 RepID=UPI00129A9C29|nr:hypothetical protein [Foetidibacter luteolus]